MNVPWKYTRCITCLRDQELTTEHIIPASLGGVLTCRFLCKTCNSRFGAGFEANARLAPEVRKAASSLKEILGDKVDQFDRGAIYQSEIDGQQIETRIGKRGKFGTTKLTDGSLLVPEDEAEKQIASQLKKSGYSDEYIEMVKLNWRKAPFSETAEIGGGISVHKWQNMPAKPTFEEASLNPLVPLKIAYEFAALIAGDIIFAKVFQPLRDALLDEDEDFASSVVERCHASKPKAFHGIAFEGSNSTARFQIRVLGALGYIVSFPKIELRAPLFEYTHWLETNEDRVLIRSPD